MTIFICIKSSNFDEIHQHPENLEIIFRLENHKKYSFHITDIRNFNRRFPINIIALDTFILL